jgi:hypothetical protein
MNRPSRPEPIHEASRPLLPAALLVPLLLALFAWSLLLPAEAAQCVGLAVPAGETLSRHTETLPGVRDGPPHGSSGRCPGARSEEH